MELLIGMSGAVWRMLSIVK